MNWRIIRALIAKDLSLFFRNRFFAIMTVFGIIMYLVIYFFVMPSSVEETLDIGLYVPPIIPPTSTQIPDDDDIDEFLGQEGIEITVVETEDKLREGVTEGQYLAGIALPEDIIDKFMAGQKPIISVYYASDTSEEIRDAVNAVITEQSYQLTGQTLNVAVENEILGPDMLGMQIPPRDRMRPLFAILLVTVEMLGLANLISEEIEKRTINALLVTPVSVKDIFISKGIIGITLAFSQAALFLAIVGGFNSQPLIVLVALMLGAVLATGIGFLTASLAKDFMSVLAWSIPTLIILVIPAFGVMFPGTVSEWIEVIPSYYLVDTVHQVTNFGGGWSDVWRSLLILLGFDMVIVSIGIIALGRKTR